MGLEQNFVTHLIIVAVANVRHVGGREFNYLEKESAIYQTMVVVCTLCPTRSGSRLSRLTTMCMDANVGRDGSMR